MKESSMTEGTRGQQGETDTNQEGRTEELYTEWDQRYGKRDNRTCMQT